MTRTTNPDDQRDGNGDDDTKDSDGDGDDDDSDGSSLLLSPDHHETSPVSCFVTFSMTVNHF